MNTRLGRKVISFRSPEALCLILLPGRIKPRLMSVAKLKKICIMSEQNHETSKHIVTEKRKMPQASIMPNSCNEKLVLYV